MVGPGLAARSDAAIDAPVNSPTQGEGVTSGAGQNRDANPVQTSAAHRLQAILATVPRCADLADLPTPVQRTPWLDGPDHPVWLKRDDATSRLYGGGKVRKLEWILANEPHANGGGRGGDVLSIGGVGSHHLLALALFLRQQGRGLHALTFVQTPTRHVMMNLATLASVGVRFWHVRTRARLPWAWLGYHLWNKPPSRGRWLTPGASSPLGMLGFVAAGLELAQQIEDGDLPRPGTIYVATGTAGTAAGLAVGLAVAGVSTHLRLVSSVEPVAFNGCMLWLKLAALGRAMQGWGHRRSGTVRRWLSDAGVSWSIDHREVGGGYGVPTDRATAAVKEAAAQGLGLEISYTGKCMSALRRDLARGGSFRPAPGPVLFWNTHGANDLEPHVVEGWLDRLPPVLRHWAVAAGAADLLR